MRRGIIREAVIIMILFLFAFLLARYFYNDPLLMGGVELLGIPLYIILVFFVLLYVAYRIIIIFIKAVSSKNGNFVK
jgi:hypothetical protein